MEPYQLLLIVMGHGSSSGPLCIVFDPDVHEIRGLYPGKINPEGFHTATIFRLEISKLGLF